MITDGGGDEHGPIEQFAALLRQERRAAGLTQADLAALAGVAVRTVRDAEHGRTGRPQRNTAELLADALGLRDARRAQFVATARGERITVPTARAPAAVETDPRGSPLPPAPTLIGRDAEVADLAQALTDPSPPGRPLTLVGVAGVGKSALALAVAHRVADRFAAGVGGVTIDEQGDVDETLATVAFVFGVADLPELAGRLARAPALLLLDAVDRAPAKVRQAMRRLPDGLRVLAAGHAPLGVPGEEVWPVGPLELPPPGTEATLEEVEAYPAAALFLHRLARVRPYPLAADEVPALVSLVRRLGGLPLALELAAAHGRLLRLPEILGRYGDRVLDLGSGEHPTLREAVAGSYRLLSASEQYALRRLAVFRHRWSVELAEEVLGGTDDPLPMLDRLVSLGLVGVSGAREHRFRLLDVVRDFATEQAARTGELAPARRAHARAITDLAARTTAELSGPNPRPAVARLDYLAADIWAALSYAANAEPHTALRLASVLARWWRLRGRDVAGRRWLRRLLDDPRTADADATVRAWAQLGVAQLADEHGDGAAERPAADAALARFRDLGDTDGELAACEVLSAVCVTQGRPDQARAFSEAALAVANRTGRLRDAAAAHARLTCHDVYMGDLASARRRLAVVDRMAGQSGQDRLRMLAAIGLAEVARMQGRYEEAATAGRRALARVAEVGDPGLRRRALATVGQALAMLGRVEESGKVLAALRSAEGTTGTAVGEAFCALIEARLAMVQGDRVSAREWFAAADAAFRQGNEPRYAVESLVGMVACTTEPDRRQRVLDELEEGLRVGGFTLLPYERELLDSTPVE
jgi:predicted ATPase/transcriptional regulator with XRE-family HTH domain